MKLHQSLTVWSEMKMDGLFHFNLEFFSFQSENHLLNVRFPTSKGGGTSTITTSKSDMAAQSPQKW